MILLYFTSCIAEDSELFVPFHDISAEAGGENISIVAVGSHGVLLQWHADGEVNMELLVQPLVPDSQPDYRTAMPHSKTGHYNVQVSKL